MRLGFILLALSGLVWLFNLNWQLPGVNFLRHKLYTLSVNKPLNQPAADTAALEAAIIDLKQENAHLRDLLGAPLSPGWQFLPSPVVKLEAETVTLAVGRSSGVKVGQTVIAYKKENINNGVILGKVSQVQAHQSQAQLLFSPDLSVKAVTASGASGLVTGDGHSAWLEQVVQADRLQRGDLIISAGGDGTIPGLALGRVGEVVKQEAAVYQKAQVNWLIDPASVVDAFIVSD